jgi:hypothetical protein
MGMGKLLRHYLDGYALFSLTLVLLHPVALAIFESLFSALVALPTPDEH